MPLDPALLDEIITAFIAGRVTVPSDRLLRALAAASGLGETELRVRFETRFRAEGHETALFDSMPFSGSG